MTALDNRTPWSVAVLGISGARGEPAMCVAIEATLHIADCSPLDAQPEIVPEGTWHGDPASSSPYDPPCALLPKQGTDCLLRGHGHARQVRFRCGPVVQHARLCGRRSWQRRWFGIRSGDEQAFEPVPLIWEEAIGPLPANPVGTGLVDRRAAFRDGIMMPRIIAPDQRALRWGHGQPPVGFGPTAPAWAHRRDLEAWDPTAQHVAAPGLIAPLLRGDEVIEIEGCQQPIASRLPGLPPPGIRVVRRRGDLQPIAVLDTVLVDADAMTMRLTWRAWCLVDGHELVDAVEVA
jgi:hypothetical protein